MRPLGLILIGIAVLVPIPWFVELAGRYDPIALFSQYLGASALIVMGIANLLATRWRPLQLVFGGLDRSYVLHKWLAIAAMTLVLLHDTIDAEIKGLGPRTILIEISETLGEISLYGFLILIVITLIPFVPYHLWRWTHRFMGGFFAASALHFALMQKPFALGDPLGLYVLAFCILGVACYVYSLVPPGTLRGGRAYRLEAITPVGDAFALDFAALGQPLRHKAGQFAVLRLQAPGLGEPHPFTISRAPAEDGSLRFTIKPLGDFTERLGSELQPGLEASVTGPYGHFRRPSESGPQIWIAAGVGITPFVAWTQAMLAQAADTAASPVHLIYCVRDRASAAHLDELEAAAANLPNLNIHLIESAHQPRLTAARVAEIADVSLAGAHVAFCGPKPMRLALRRDLTAIGLRRSRFLYEEFELRTGVGLRRAAAWLLQRALDANAQRDARTTGQDAVGGAAG